MVRNLLPLCLDGPLKGGADGAEAGGVVAVERPTRGRKRKSALVEEDEEVGFFFII